MTVSFKEALFEHNNWGNSSAKEWDGQQVFISTFICEFYDKQEAVTV